MRIRLFYHSAVSSWNHGNAHFLRGVARELQALGHEVVIYEPVDGWSRQNLIAERGPMAVEAFHARFPHLRVQAYDPATFDALAAVEDADLVVVHEWNDPALVRELGLIRRRHDFRLLFHDTHHRAVTAPQEITRYDLRHYDGVLAFGAVLRDLYLNHSLTARAWTWHEAADTRLFRPLRFHGAKDGDLVWIGNWGDGERTRELHEFLLEPVRQLNLRARIYGVRYPDHARAALDRAGIEYAGWLPNDEAPAVFARYGATVHVPRRPYVEALPGIPTIRVFEALACGIPLVSAPWPDVEDLFTPGQDFLVAHDGQAMRRHLRDVLHDADLAQALREHGLATVRARHTCAHRAAELMEVAAELGLAVPHALPAVAAGAGGGGGS